MIANQTANFSSLIDVKILSTRKVFLNEFSLSFLTTDGHRENCKNVSLHICSPVNFYVPATGSILDESDEDKKMLAEILKSGIPTILLSDKTSDIDLILESLKGSSGDTDLSKDNVWVSILIKSLAHLFSEISNFEISYL